FGGQLRGDAAQFGADVVELHAGPQAGNRIERLRAASSGRHLAGEGQIGPGVRHFWKRESLRHDADDLEGKSSFDADRLSDHVRRPAERSLPEAVAEDILSLVLWIEGAAENGPAAKH